MKPLKAEKLPIRGLKLEKLQKRLAKAYFVLGRYEEILRTVESPEKIFSILLKEEALSSLRSQRISISLRKLLEAEAVGKNIKGLVRVKNYERALTFAMRTCKNGRVSLALIRKIHALLSQKSMMQKTNIGRFRKKQNWVGPRGCKIEEAYILPPKASDVPGLMKNLVRYSEEEKLVQIAIFFAQLLVIHPFMDGNGRVGRILLPIGLFKAKLLSYPLFFFSNFFYVHRVLYFTKLHMISSQDDWEGWITFFLKGVIEQGEINCKKAERINALYLELRAAMEKMTEQKRARRLAQRLFEHPIFEEKDFPSSLLHKLTKRGYLKRIRIEKEKRWIFPPLFKAIQTKKP